ncbi:hypothetical protein [Paracoccus seriniphilus]|uniref:Lipoprotein n=1 Tax=Paracoccus seriniphilus TaxID=184748 RepID=A0A239PN22_9RHOB|nr:hypothetical protein [Paracoccus seriniphilus]WCR14870.1 hypothetical protein JHW44_05385 [Paracoccus seriniphilus]SNT71711.1 hypothetical protein SAMN05444959_102225 [Paracoccus seriniphilus]
MRPAYRQPQTFIAALGFCAVLSGCAADNSDGRPPEKPDHVTASIVTTGKSGGAARLGQARISTKSGEILILEEDGSVTKMNLDSPAGRDAFEVTEADLMALNANLDLDLTGATGGRRHSSGPTAQEKAIAEFARRTQPALPEWRDDKIVASEDFLGSKVVTLGDGKKTDLVEVTANLREGVDADIAFSYATCALAGWAKAEGARYGRHIRTLQQTRDGKLLIGAAFTISDSKPLGLRVMETNETLRECKARGIPAA